MHHKPPSAAHLLPSDEWIIQKHGPDHIAAGCHELRGYVYWTKHKLSDLPNDLIGIEDLKRFGIVVDGVDMATVK